MGLWPPTFSAMTTPSSIGSRLRHLPLANTLQGMVGLRSLYTDEVVDSHQIMMMNDYMPTKVNNLYKALLPLG